ncbi:MAG: hypothetical protein ACRD4R_01810 [Candidatus Acidiferrales bacterium]
MNTKEAKDFLVQEVAQQASLDHVPLSNLEKQMLYFVENDPTSCENPIELNDEFEAQYDTPEYEAKIARLLSRAYKRLKADEPQKVSYWDDAMLIISRGEHYLPVMWHAQTATINRKFDSGSKVVVCGGVAIFVLSLIISLFKVPSLPSWIVPTLGALLLLLCLLTMFFLVQQGYRALRQKFGKQPN